MCADAPSTIPLQGLWGKNAESGSNLVQPLALSCRNAPARIAVRMTSLGIAKTTRARLPPCHRARD
jgi:hypothetical protein